MLQRLLCVIISIIGLNLATAIKAHPMPPAVVETVNVKAQNWQPQIPATGTLFAHQGVILRSEIAGRVTMLHFQPGQSVRQGAALVDINPAILVGQLHSQQAQLQLNEANYRRGQQLFNKKLYAKAELDKLLALLHISKAEVVSAQAKLAQAKIQAPFAGKLGLNKVHVGDYVTSGQELVSLQALNPMRIDFNIPEIYASKLAIGQKVTITVANIPGQVFEGKLTGIDSMIEPKTRSISVRADIPNQEQKLLPGAFAEVTLYLGQPQSVLTVPQQAIVYEQGKHYIFKIATDKAIKVQVKVGKRIDNDIIIEQGLSANTAIVIAGQMKLIDQAPVIVKSVAG